MRISEQVYEHLNASKYAVELPENLGGGRMAIFEMIHQIHCVVGVPRFILKVSHLTWAKQALWQAAYPDYYTEQREFRNSHPEEWYGHIGESPLRLGILSCRLLSRDAFYPDHCADMLRQKLMCDADTSIVTYNWMKGHSRPHPNFNVQHQCRDFGTALKFAQDNQIDKDNGDRIDVNLLKSTNGRIMEFEGEPPYDPDAVPWQS